MNETKLNPWRRLPGLFWKMPLIAIPFGLFFGTLFGGGEGWPAYRVAYFISLVFAFTIGLSMWSWDHFGLPGVQSRLRAPMSGWMVGVSYLVVSLLASYTAAAIVHFTFLPGFMGSARALLINGMFAVLFTALFGGIFTAMSYHREAVERARAVERMRAELAQAELRALRAQINPHFLFNTLNSIAALIVVNPRAAEDTTTRLADVFRYVLQGSDRESVALGEELAFLRSYLEIEHTRFGDRLRVEQRIEPGLERLRVPTLLLQPLVENAVRYGISGRAEGGTVRLTARREGERLILEVRDDGPGMDGPRPPGGTGFGLHSVRERLRAAGPPSALEIETSPGAGTLVRVVLPIVPESSNPSSKGVPT